MSVGPFGRASPPASRAYNPPHRSGGTPIAATLLFVYGTLKRGLKNHHFLAGQTFRGEAVTEPRYRVIDLGPFPGLVVDEAAGLAVKGELWVVSSRCLAELDEFEGVAGPFVRNPIALPDHEGVVYAYFLNEPVPDGAPSGAEWPLPGV